MGGRASRVARVAPAVRVAADPQSRHAGRQSGDRIADRRRRAAAARPRCAVRLASRGGRSVSLESVLPYRTGGPARSRGELMCRRRFRSPSGSTSPSTRLPSGGWTTSARWPPASPWTRYPRPGDAGTVRVWRRGGDAAAGYAAEEAVIGRAGTRRAVERAQARSTALSTRSATIAAPRSIASKWPRVWSKNSWDSTGGGGMKIAGQPLSARERARARHRRGALHRRSAGPLSRSAARLAGAGAARARLVTRLDRFPGARRSPAW